jgi:primosomal protein N' (replication factor Y)
VRLVFARVVVDVASNNTDDAFTYIVPKDLVDCIYIGSRVYVEFGFRKVLGYVLELVQEIDYSGSLKEILEVIDFEEGLTLEQLELSKKINKDTKAFLSSCLGLMYPSFLKSRIRKFINVKNYNEMDADLAMLFGNKTKVQIDKGILSKYSKVKKEIERGNIEITSDFFRYGSRKVERYYRVIKSETLSSRRSEVLDFVKGRGEATADEIQDNTGCSDYLIARLVKENYLEIEERIPLVEKSDEVYSKTVNYNFDQQQLRDKFNKLKDKPFLLYTNDEEFKLDFFLDITMQSVKLGKQVLIITPTLIVNKIIFDYFRKNARGYRIFNFSSKLSTNEYYSNFTNVQKQNVDIVIGTKANIFLPLNNLGLIIMVDEDDINYYVEQNPKYNVLDVLLYRSKFQKAKFLLSSSALRIETYYNYFTAKYFFLKHLIQKQNQVRLVDMHEEVGDLLLSKYLQQALKKRIEEKEASLLILNNLSYNTDIICKSCGHFQKCPKCKVGLVFHKQKNLYRCPSCNLQVSLLECENCNSHDFKHFGYGLERLKERLLELFPKVKIIQVDSGSMQEKEAYNEFFSLLEENEIDIIIGTNQLAGLVHPSIKLQCIISADSILNRNDYRSSEITFGLISKINRQDVEVIIQGYNLSHPAIRYALDNDFETFYNQEIEIRKNYNYPPFAEVNKLEIIGDYRDIYYYANYFKKIAVKILRGECLGPVYETRIKGVRLLIKHNNFERLSSLIDEVNNKFSDKKLIVNFERYPKIF